MGKHYIGPVGRPTGPKSVSLKNCQPCLSVSVRTPPRVSDRVRSIWLSVSFKKNDRFVGRLRSGPRLVADSADAVFTPPRGEGFAARVNACCIQQVKMRRKFLLVQPGYACAVKND